MSSPTLRVLTGLLGGTATSAPEHPDDQRALFALADGYGLVPALWVALREHAGWVEIPEHVVAAIEGHMSPGMTITPFAAQTAYEANGRRNATLVDAGCEILGRLDVEGVPVLPLKGLHGLLMGLWTDPAVRVMRDIDLLVPVERSAEAFEILRGLGFVEPPPYLPEGHRHLPMLCRGPVTVELHTSALDVRWRAILPASDIWTEAATSSDGAAGWRMTATHAVACLIAHAQLEDASYDSLVLPVRELYETSIWWRRSGVNIDWADVQRRFGSVHRRRTFDSHLTACRELFGAPTHPPVPLASLAGTIHARVAIRGVAGPGIVNARRYVHLLPHSFSRPRMVEFYGPPRGVAWVWRARWRHSTRRIRAHVLRAFHRAS